MNVELNGEALDKLEWSFSCVFTLRQVVTWDILVRVQSIEESRAELDAVD